MKRFIFFFIFIICSLTFSRLWGSEWRLHSTLGTEVESVVDTPDAVYFLCHAEKYDQGNMSLSNRNCFLFKFDKDADELLNLNRQNVLSDQIVSRIKYNPEKKYLCITYDNGNIDLLYDDGKIINIDGFRISDMPSKNINYIYFDNQNSIIYLATDFGYIAIDDKNASIKESRNYSKKITALAVFKGQMFLTVDNTVYYAPLSSKLHNFSYFSVFPNLTELREFIPLSNGEKLICIQGYRSFGFLFYLTSDNDGIHVNGPFASGSYTGIGEFKNGVQVNTPTKCFLFNNDNSTSELPLPEKENTVKSFSWDGINFWFAHGIEGFMSEKYENGGWTVTRNLMEPDASNVFKSSFMKYHPEYGLLVNNHGNDRNFEYVYGDNTPVLLSALKGSNWKGLAPLRSNPEFSMIQINPNGLAIDPSDNDKVFTGSMQSGILRISLSAPDDLLHLSNPADPASGHQSFKKVAENQKAWGMPDNFCSFSAPAFDRAGNMWIAYFDLDKNQGNNRHAELWYWTPENRLASKDPASFRPFGKIILEGTAASNNMFLMPLTMQGASNMVIYSSNSDPKAIYLIDHKGTLENTADDQIVRLSNIFNQDGTQVELDFVMSAYEDHDTGHVWIGTTNGLFTFRPADVIKDPTRVNNIKVARNDGTDLADYLLDKSRVNHITADPSGRKWFATAGGVVCASADGRNIISQYTSDNSMLPDNMVYNVTYNPENNSMMISTAKGLAELFLTSAATGEGEAKARAYPNPVRPDYFGYVTIDSLNDNALVKICDAAGNLVKELGLAPGGEAKWDVTDMYHRRVNSGVYHVLASDGPDGSGWSSVTKILVVN